MDIKAEAEKIVREVPTRNLRDAIIALCARVEADTAARCFQIAQEHLVLSSEDANLAAQAIATAILAAFPASQSYEAQIRANERARCAQAIVNVRESFIGTGGRDARSREMQRRESIYRHGLDNAEAAVRKEE